MKQSYYTGLAFLTLLAVFLFFYHEVIFFNRVPALRDLAKFFFPMKYYLYLHLHNFTLPLWIPHISLGKPFLANFQSGVFYPPSLLFLLPSPTAAFQIFFLFHYGVLALGGFCYLRHMHRSPAVALLGTLILTFGGFMVSLGNVLTHLQAASWFPFLLLFHTKLTTSPSWPNFLIFTLLELLHFLGGTPEIFLMTNGVLMLLALYCSFEERSFFPLPLLRLFGSLAVVVLIALPQILPTLEMLRLSVRWERFGLEDLARWSFTPVSLLSLFLPRRFRNPEGHFGFHSLLETEVPWVLSMYPGALTLPIALFFLWQGEQREKYLWGALFPLGLLLAMGIHTPLFPFLLSSFPPLAMFRFPEKFLYMVHISLFMLSSHGLALLLEGGERGPRRKFLLLLGGLSLVVLIPYLLFLLRLDVIVSLLGWLKAHGYPLNLNPRAMAGLGVNCERLLLITLAGTLLFLALERAWVRKGTFTLLFISLISFDLLAANRVLNLYVDARLLLLPSQAARLCGAPSHNYRIAHDLKVAVYDPYIPLEEQEWRLLRLAYPNTGITEGLDHLFGMDGIELMEENLLSHVLDILPLNQRLKLLEALNVRFLVTGDSLSSPHLVKAIPLAEEPFTLYELRAPGPRAYLAYRSHAAPGPIETANLIIQENFDSQRDVVVQEPSLHLTGAPHPDDYVKITSYGDREVSLEFRSHSPAILVLNDAFYPGWKATVDGREIPTFRANWWVRGIAVEEGRHSAVFRYEPAMFFLGIKLSLLFLTALCLLLVLSKISGWGPFLRRWLPTSPTRTES